MVKQSVCVVMSTYNGEKYLGEQMESILRQEGCEVTVFVRDDGSSDETVSILQSYREQGVQFLSGENCGAKKSFLLALREAPEAEFYAFADQDDVWDSDKLSVAVGEIQKAQRNNPGKCVLYSCRTCLVDENLREIHVSKKDKASAKTSLQVRPFLRGQTRNSAGCTMVFNRVLRDLVCRYMPTVYSMHDAWVRQVCLAVGGIFLYDPVPHILYRQHGANAVGGKRGIGASLLRRLSFYKRMGRCYYTKMLQEIYGQYKDRMPAENIERYTKVSSYKKSFRNRIALLCDKEFFHGSFRYRVETFILVLFGLY